MSPAGITPLGGNPYAVCIGIPQLQALARLQSQENLRVIDVASILFKALHTPLPLSWLFALSIGALSCSGNLSP